MAIEVHTGKMIGTFVLAVAEVVDRDYERIPTHILKREHGRYAPITVRTCGADLPILGWCLLEFFDYNSTLMCTVVSGAIDTVKGTGPNIGFSINAKDYNKCIDSGNIADILEFTGT